MEPCPIHGKPIATAEVECPICDCRWLLANGEAEDPEQTARDLEQYRRGHAREATDTAKKPRLRACPPGYWWLGINTTP